MIALFISIIAIVLTIVLYFKNPASTLLRILALVMLFLLITNFTLAIRSKVRHTPPIVLVDCSASMNRHLPTIMQYIDSITFQHTRLFFSESLSQAAVKNGRFTNITSAISGAQKLHPEAILLISDGNHNYGESPLSIIDEVDVPIHSFGVGGELQKDVAIIDISYPTYAFKDDSIKIEVVLQSKGFESGEGKIELTLPSRKTTLQRTFPLSDVVAKHTIDFTLWAVQPGQESIHIYCLPQPDEETYENNEFDVSLHILGEKIRVLYYSDHLSFNTKFVVRALHEDNLIELTPFTKIREGRFLDLIEQRAVQTLPNSSDFDVLLLDNVNLRQLPWRDIRTFLNQGKGILCVGRIDGLTTEWSDILPINITHHMIKGEHRITMVQPFSCLAVGEDYPPLVTINRVLGAKENAVVLAVTGRLPIIAYRNYENGILFQINGMDIGLWQFLQVGVRQKNVLTCLLGDIVRFLSPLGQKRRLVLTSLQTNYVPGEVVQVNLQSYDRNFKLKGGGDFYIEFDETRVPFFETKEGMYEATFIAEKGGVLELQATGRLDDEALTSDTYKLFVGPQTKETEQGFNAQLMKTIAEKTSGKSSMVEELRTFQLPESIESYMSWTIRLNSPITYFVIFVLLAIDWIVRRRRGII